MLWYLKSCGHLHFIISHHCLWTWNHQLYRSSAISVRKEMCCPPPNPPRKKNGRDLSKCTSSLHGCFFCSNEHLCSRQKLRWIAVQGLSVHLRIMTSKRAKFRFLPLAYRSVWENPEDIPFWVLMDDFLVLDHSLLYSLCFCFPPSGGMLWVRRWWRRW